MLERQGVVNLLPVGGGAGGREGVSAFICIAAEVYYADFGYGLLGRFFLYQKVEFGNYRGRKNVLSMVVRKIRKPD